MDNERHGETDERREAGKNDESGCGDSDDMYGMKAMSSELAALVCRGADERQDVAASIPIAQDETHKSLLAAAKLMNASSASAKSQLAASMSTFSRAVSVMKELRADLDYIHKHSHSLKRFIMEKYPETKTTLLTGRPKEDG